MANSFLACYMHCVFSTRDRRNSLYEDMRPRLFEYFGAIARDNKMHLRRAGGVDDHVHLLLSLPGSLSVSEAMRIVKSGSSRWIHETFPQLSDFSWQEGYGAFSVSASALPDVQRYIQRQPSHHERFGYREELIELLRRYGLEFDERYIL